jgi:redox-sensitive bicupin YhaK (pirin superfamily)
LDQELPASYNGFLYVLDGDAIAGGHTTTRLATGQVGWLDRTTGNAATLLHVEGGAQGARVVLYAGERQNVPIVMHGPFVGENRQDLMRVSQEFLSGRMPRVSQL